MKRRAFILALGVAAVLPFPVRAQQPRRVGVLLNLSENDAESPARIAAFQGALDRLGWTIGRNVRIDYRWYMGDTGRARVAAAELIALSPDVIVANANIATQVLKEATKSIP